MFIFIFIFLLYFNCKFIISVWSFGPRRCGPNLLLNRVNNLSIQSPLDQSNNNNNSNSDNKDTDHTLSRMVNNSIINGFQLASGAGPLCNEPLMGVCFVVEDVKISEWDIEKRGPDPYGPLSGQVIAAIRDLCWKSFTGILIDFFCLFD